VKKLLLTGCAALLLVTEAAHAGQTGSYSHTFPPAEYDKPYVGNLFIVHIATEKEMSAACKGVNKYAVLRVH
jgi:hypothetical protein